MRNVFLLTLVWFAGLTTPDLARAYYGAIPTLNKLNVDAAHVVVYEVDKVSREKQVVIFKKVADLKGKDAPDVAKHKLTDGFQPRQARTLLDWAEPGKTAICFINDRASLTCIGGFWYDAAAGADNWWTMTGGRPELSYAYSGSTTKLRDHVLALVAGKETVITALKYRLFFVSPQRWIERKWEHWDTNEAVGARRLMRGKDWPVCRIKAGPKMPSTVHQIIIHHSHLILGDGPGNADDVPALIKALQHEDALIRLEAADDLGQIGGPAAAAIEALLKMSEQDAEPLIRLEAAKAAASIDPKNETAISSLVKTLQDKNGRVRKRAAECLGDLGCGEKSAVDALVKAVGDADPTVTWAAIDALGQIGPAAAAAVPILADALKDASRRGAAVGALGQIGKKAQAAVPALEKLIQGDDVGARWAAASALVKIGGSGLKTGVRYLLETGTRERERNWTDANNILIAPSSRAALPVMLDAVRDPAIRELAAQTAEDMSTYLMKDPLADVKTLVDDNDAGVRCVTAWIQHCARAVDLKEVLPVLRETRKAKDPWARRQAVRYLGRLGPYAKDAAEDIAASLKDPDEGVRDAAAQALKNIQGM